MGQGLKRILFTTVALLSLGLSACVVGYVGPVPSSQAANNGSAGDGNNSQANTTQVNSQPKQVPQRTLGLIVTLPEKLTPPVGLTFNGEKLLHVRTLGERIHLYQGPSTQSTRSWIDALRHTYPGWVIEEDRRMYPS